MKTPDKKTLKKEAALWKSVKILLETTPVPQCHK
jgi:hypothetical protein